GAAGGEGLHGSLAGMRDRLVSHTDDAASSFFRPGSSTRPRKSRHPPRVRDEYADQRSRPQLQGVPHDPLSHRVYGGWRGRAGRRAGPGRSRPLPDLPAPPPPSPPPAAPPPPPPPNPRSNSPPPPRAPGPPPPPHAH